MVSLRFLANATWSAAVVAVCVVSAYVVPSLSSCVGACVLSWLVGFVFAHDMLKKLIRAQSDVIAFMSMTKKDTK